MWLRGIVQIKYRSALMAFKIKSRFTFVVCVVWCGCVRERERDVYIYYVYINIHVYIKGKYVDLCINIIFNVNYIQV